MNYKKGGELLIFATFLRLYFFYTNFIVTFALVK